MYQMYNFLSMWYNIGMGNKNRNWCRIVPINPHEQILHHTLVKPDIKKIKDLCTLRSAKNVIVKGDSPWAYLEAMTGVDRVYLHQLMKRVNISLLYLRYIAEALNVDVNELCDFGGFYHLLEK